MAGRRQTGGVDLDGGEGGADRAAAGQIASSPEELAAALIARLRPPLAAGAEPVFVGLDGRSGAGKSTVAAAVADGLDVAVTVVAGDDFYGGGSAATWDARGPAGNAAAVIDWHRQAAVLTALRERGAAAWQPFDWESPAWDGDEVPLAADVVRAVVAPVVLLEGVYSCRPQLAELLDLRVLLAVPRTLRRARLLQREGEAHDTAWDARWAAAEAHYFRHEMPPKHFDLVLP